MRIPNLVLSTIILFLSNLLVRVLGFLYKIFLSHNISEFELGIYHMLFSFLMICLALTTTGIPISLSNIISKKNALKANQDSNKILLSVLYVSSTISAIVALFTIFNASFISTKILNTSSFSSLVIALSPSIIVITLSNILRGYYYGLKDVFVPAFGQLLEQISRILFVFLAILFLNNKSLNCYIAILGISVGEIVNILFIIFCLYKGKYFDSKSSININDIFVHSHPVLEGAMPLTINRIISTFIHNFSSIIIPSRLALSGIAYKQSLAIFGVINGMVMPLIYIPFTVGSALVVNLIPSLSQDVALNKKSKVKLKIFASLCLSFIVGLITWFLFYFSSSEICVHIFHNTLAGVYLKEMSLIPLFLVLNQTISSILHTLGKEFISSFVSIFFSILQLLSIYFLVSIPSLNIFGYIYSLTIYSGLTFLFQFYILLKTLK